MRVFITGGNGLVGTPISEKFAQNGWDVRVIGIEPHCALPGITYTQCDILDAGALAEHAAGCDAIVHLAAIPHTRSHPNPRLFEINTAGTFNVFEAAARAGIKRVVQASSINALGGYWGCDDRQFAYFPLDEAHPPHTTDAYSFSKQVVENIADYYWRRAGISSVSFRLPAVWNSQTLQQRGTRQDIARQVRQLDAFLALPKPQQQRRLAAVRQHVLELRARHILEYEATQAGDFERESRAADDWLWSAYFFDRYNYWTFIHTDDSTQAFERALTADFSGAHPLFVNSARNYLGYETETLLGLFFPQVRQRRSKLAGTASPVSFARAQQLLGYQPTVNHIA